MAETLCPMTFNNPEQDDRCEREKCEWWIKHPAIETPMCAIRSMAIHLFILTRQTMAISEKP